MTTSMKCHLRCLGIDVDFLTCARFLGFVVGRPILWRNYKVLMVDK